MISKSADSNHTLQLTSTRWLHNPTARLRQRLIRHLTVPSPHVIRSRLLPILALQRIETLVSNCGSTISCIFQRPLEHIPGPQELSCLVNGASRLVTRSHLREVLGLRSVEEDCAGVVVAADGFLFETVVHGPGEGVI